MFRRHKKKERQVAAAPSERAWVARLKNIGTGAEQRLMVENLAMMLEAGMDVLGALTAIGEEMRTKRMKQVTGQIIEDIAGGLSLWRALERAQVLETYVISLIRIGEEAGRLVENLRVIVVQQQKEHEFRSKLRSAMAYPVLVLTIAVVIALGMSVFVLPRLTAVFDSLDITLPPTTRALVWLGAFMRENGAWFAPTALAGFAVLLFFLFGWSKTKIAGQFILWRLPGVKRLIKEVELARLGYIFGTLLAAGLPIVKAIESLRDATVFYMYRALYSQLAREVETGQALTAALKSYKRSSKIIPPSMQHLIAAGEQTGHLPDVLEKIGRIYDAKTETTAKNLTTILEPLLLFVVWGGVAGVALAIIMPIYGLIGGFEANRQSGGERPPAPAATAAPTPQSGSAAAGQAPVEEISESVVEGYREFAHAVRVIETPTGRLNVREEPDLEAEVITQIETGEAYPAAGVIEDEEGEIAWHRLRLPGDEETGEQAGYVAAEFVEVLEPFDEAQDEPEVEGITSELIDLTLTAEEEARLQETLELELEKAVADEIKKRQLAE